jgi:hypothetical protein
MAAHHYVSKFHLREFCDPESLGTPDPWLWVGDLSDGSVRRRAPKNVGTAPDLFDGPGGMAQHESTIEEFLAQKVEGPAAKALRVLTSGGHTKLNELPPELMRYLAWAASRSLPMQRLEVQWSLRFGALLDGPFAEPAPEALTKTADRIRPLQLLHPTLGEMTVPPGQELGILLDAGWIPDPHERSNFLEGVHIQAHYFQVRWFPRLRWFTLRPPPGEFFIIGDRPVGWGVPDCLDAPPCCLREPSAFLIAPLSRSLALVGRNDPNPWAVSPEQVNAILAAWSYDWIAGPTQEIVASVLHRHSAVGGGREDSRGATKVWQN